MGVHGLTRAAHPHLRVPPLASNLFPLHELYTELKWIIVAFVCKFRWSRDIATVNRLLHACFLARCSCCTRDARHTAMWRVLSFSLICQHARHLSGSVVGIISSVFSS